MIIWVSDFVSIVILNAPVARFIDYGLEFTDAKVW